MNHIFALLFYPLYALTIFNSITWAKQLPSKRKKKVKKILGLLSFVLWWDKWREDIRYSSNWELCIDGAPTQVARGQLYSNPCDRINEVCFSCFQALNPSRQSMHRERERSDFFLCVWTGMGFISFETWKLGRVSVMNRQLHYPMVVMSSFQANCRPLL